LAAAKPQGPIDEQTKFGTVGAVALDAQGHLAAATSTGGMTNKQVGRVGDAPIIGAGCYANDATVAISCTGTGEAFMRTLAAHDVSAQMQYLGLDVHSAAQRVVFETLPRIDGRGGMIAVAANGELCMPFNTEGMYRGYVRVGEPPVVAIYADKT
jgi:beta-aspartyl-peptidase (threonine type)